jgi:hypothetical protein
MCFPAKHPHNAAVSTWSLKVNDPTIFAWLSVAAYFLAGLSSFVCARRLIRMQERSFWFGVAALCGLLAVNKQVDAHSALMGLLRDPEAGGTIALLVSLAFIVPVSCASYLILRTFIAPSRSMVMAVGALFILAVILVGRNTVPGVSHILGFHLTSETETLLHLHVSELFELGLAIVIWLSARRASGASEPRIGPRLPPERA